MKNILSLIFLSLYACKSDGHRETSANNIIVDDPNDDSSDLLLTEDSFSEEELNFLASQENIYLVGVKIAEPKDDALSMTSPFSGLYKKVFGKKSEQAVGNNKINEVEKVNNVGLKKAESQNEVVEGKVQNLKEEDLKVGAKVEYQGGLWDIWRVRDNQVMISRGEVIMTTGKKNLTRGVPLKLPKVGEKTFVYDEGKVSETVKTEDTPDRYQIVDSIDSLKEGDEVVYKSSSTGEFIEAKITLNSGGRMRATWNNLPIEGKVEQLKKKFEIDGLIYKKIPGLSENEKKPPMEVSNLKDQNLPKKGAVVYRTNKEGEIKQDLGTKGFTLQSTDIEKTKKFTGFGMGTFEPKNPRP